MNSSELINRLDKYIKDNNLTATKMANLLGIRKETISHWRKGRDISASNREAISVLIKPEEDYLRDIPGGNLTAHMLEEWKMLDQKQRLKVLDCIEDLKNRSNGESSLGECQANVA